MYSLLPTSDANATLVISSINLLAVFVMGIIVVSYLLYDMFQKTGITALQFIKGFFTEPECAYRVPVGYLILFLGLAIRTLVAIPRIILMQKHLIEKADAYNLAVTPLLWPSTEYIIYVAACIIFWPTIKCIILRLFGPLPESFVNTAALIWCVIFKLFLFAIGLLVYNILQIYIT